MNGDLPRAAGLAVPLFSLCGADDAGSGQILDLIPFIDWMARWHQRVVQLLPIHETAPREASPYTALSAFAIDPGFISAANVIDVSASAAAQRWLLSPQVRAKLRQLHAAPLRDRYSAYAFTLRLLEFGFGEFATRSPSDERRQRFDDFSRRNAWWLDDYALFRAIKERRQWANWETWPQELQGRDSRALARAADRLRARVRFARYLQWVAAEQWGAVRAHARARGVLLKGDLPFVCGRDSADVWARQDLFDASSSVGAPPDAFSPTGQAWGLPLYNWDAIRAHGYAWWRQRARRGRDLFDMFRVDHVIGLYRTYAIPMHAGGTAGFVPQDEAAQQQQGREVLSAMLDETGSATTVIAEDLGTVPDWARASLTALGIPGYKVFRWERSDTRYLDPRTYPALSVATTGTHDTETLVQWWQELGPGERESIISSLGLDAVPLQSHAPELPWSAPLHLGILQRLYESGSALTILPLQDLFGWTERINTPATITPRNWAYRLPVTIDALDATPEIRERMARIRDMTDATGRYDGS